MNGGRHAGGTWDPHARWTRFSSASIPVDLLFLPFSLASFRFSLCCSRARREFLTRCFFFFFFYLHQVILYVLYHVLYQGLFSGTLVLFKWLM